MATGSIKTPVILQQSGIGPTSVLQAAGVTQLLNLPIGQNLIDQTTSTTDFTFSGNRGGGQVITFPRFQVSCGETGSDIELPADTELHLRHPGPRDWFRCHDAPEYAAE